MLPRRKRFRVIAMEVEGVGQAHSLAVPGLEVLAMADTGSILLHLRQVHT
jgi:hypothetical protein